MRASMDADQRPGNDVPALTAYPGCVYRIPLDHLRPGRYSPVAEQANERIPQITLDEYPLFIPQDNGP